MDSDTLECLVAGTKAGDKDASNELLTEFNPIVFSWCLKHLNNYANAQDVSQEVLIQVILKIDQLRNNRCFAGWIKSMTRRMCINYRIRDSHRHNKHLFEESHSYHPDDCVELAERIEKTHIGLAELSDLDKRTLRDFYFAGLCLLDIAYVEEAPVGTIKRRLFTARHRLATVLADYYPELFTQ